MLLLILGLFVCVIHAQDRFQNNEIQTIFSKNRGNGGYGAFTLGYSLIDGKDALITGGRGAFIFGQSLAIGLGGFGFVNDLDYHTYYNDQLLNYSLLGDYGVFLLNQLSPEENRFIYHFLYFSV